MIDSISSRSLSGGGFTVATASQAHVSALFATSESILAGIVGLCQPSVLLKED
jgi:hypothetical protein